jgi:HK97 family phage portal protein
MSIINRLFRSRDKPKNLSSNGASFLFGQPSSSGQIVNERTAMQSVAVFACVRILSESVAGLPLHIFHNLPDGGRERTQDHPLFRILHDEPNSEMSSFVFRETLMGHLLLWGNAFAQIVRNGRGQVVALYPLLPSKMEVGRGNGGQLIYRYYRDSDECAQHHTTGYVTLRQEDVLHIPALGYDGLIGFSPISMARNAIGMSLAAEDYGARFYANSANPSGVLEHPGVLRDPDKLRQSWHEQFSGAGQHRIAVLEEGLQFKAMSIHPADAQFLETRRFQLNEIARLFRIPPSMIGDLERATYSNAEQMSLDFVKFTINPWVARLEQAFQQCLLLPSEKGEYFIRFNLDGLLRGDYKTRMEGYSIGIQNGIFSVNDVRSLEEMNPLPDEEGGNLHVLNGNMIKLIDASLAYNRGQNNQQEETT